MPVTKSAGYQDSGTDANENDRSIDRMDVDTFGESTGGNDGRRTACGVEAMRRSALRDGSFDSNEGRT